MSVDQLLQQAAQYAADYYAELASKPVAAMGTRAELLASLDKGLPDLGTPAEVVLSQLVRDAEPGILRNAGGRFFGWVMGGSLPVALAADWMTSTWDQNAALYASNPSIALIEEICGRQLKELFGLPSSASFAFVTGCQMAHVTALAAARHHLLAQRGWEVETRGLFAAPPIRIFTGELRHESVERAVRILGLGTDCLHKLPCGSDGALQIDALDQALRSDSDLPTVVCLQAGEINTGAFDPFEQAIELAHKNGAWVHVDGAFGLWARVSPKYSDLLAGVENADSWATDAHKWLNVPFDSGMLFVAHPEAHRAAMSTRASYLIHSQDSSRDQIDWTPEWSRRGRAVPIYAAIRHLGRSGLRDLIERCCAHAHRLVNEIGQLPGAEVIAPAIINQGLVRFLADDGDHNRRTDLVIEKIQEEGTAWFGGTTWGGQRAMRISVCNWQTSEQDVDRTIAAVRAILLQ